MGNNPIRGINGVELKIHIDLRFRDGLPTLQT